MNKCEGCGAVLQNVDNNNEGYTNNLDSKLCERCFRIRHYNEYKQVIKNNQDFLPILKEINDSKALVLLVADLFLLNEDFSLFREYLKNDILLVLTKRDILPYKIQNETLIEHINLKVNPIDIQVISSNKNYQLDELMDKISKYKTSKIYVVGFTNAGKSTLMNHILKHYYHENIEITTSPLPSTTLSSIEIKLPDITFVDTPGFLDEGSLLEKVDGKALKKILPKREIRPITYQVRAKQMIVIDNYAVLELNENNNCTLFFSNLLKIERFFNDKKINEEFVSHKIKVKAGEDIVISGLGFIKCTKSSEIIVSTFKNVSVFTRNSLI